MSKNPVRRLRAVTAAGIVIAGLSAALPAYATLPGSTAPNRPTAAVGSDTSAPAAISETTVIPARTFVDSVGVGVHLSRSEGSYANYPAVKSALLELGIHHIRDSINWQESKYLDLNQSGIKTLATVPRTASTDSLLATAINNVEKLRPALSGIGGPNEYETTVSDWVSKLTSFQSRIYAKVNASPTLSDVPVLGPSLQTATNEHLLGNISRYLDLGAVHAYPQGNLPEELVDDYIREAAVTSGSKPIVVTETGMSNANDPLRQQYDLAYSERAAGIYTPRLVMEYFRLGVKRTYIYQLLCEDNVAGLRPKSRYFGLLRKDFSPRPTFTAMKTLLRTLADTGSQVTTRPLSYTVSSTSNLRQLTFQKSDGSYYIALWNPVSVWSGGPGGHDLYPAPARATLNLPFAAQSVQVIDTAQGSAPVKTVRGADQVQLDVTPSVQLVHVMR